MIIYDYEAPVCDCIIPKHWPKNEPWSHRDGCPKKARLIAALRQRWGHD